MNKIKKFSSLERIVESDTWQDRFKDQSMSGKYWKELFKEEFNRHRFLDRSAAVHICKKAQSDAYEKVIKELSGKVDESVIKTIQKMIDDNWENDESGLGMEEIPTPKY